MTRIAEVATYRVVHPVAHRTYGMSGGRQYSEYASTVVRVTADDGTSGYGEACTMGGDYIDGFPESSEATMRKLGPVVVGCDPFRPVPLVRRMDAAVLGHAPAKAAIDIAMWDLRGRLLSQPVAALLGGVAQTTVEAFDAIPTGDLHAKLEDVRRMVGEGYTRWQIKVGDDPVTDAAHVHALVDAIGPARRYLACDANRSYTVAEALRFLRAIADIDTYVEQPCASIAELAQVNAASSHPLIIDEAARTPRDLLDAIALGCVAGVSIKPVRVGGLTTAALMRDIAQAAGLMVCIDEPQGGQLAVASMVQLAATVDPARLLAVTYFGDKAAPVPDPTGDGGAWFRDGTIAVPLGPGLGFVPDPVLLGQPVVVTRQDGRTA